MNTLYHDPKFDGTWTISTAEAMKGVLDLPLKLLRVTSQHQIQAPYNEATQWFDQEYIFLNLDDSKLQ
ncbi:MAG: hypothetical protein IPN95_01960 [Bacteroidetes bacterium]|nr:hypothetical protein [Bacteroidota bacterium]